MLLLLCSFFGAGVLFTQNVGVGTITPLEKLHVYADGTVGLRVETNTGNSKLKLQQQSGQGFEFE